MVVDVGLRVGYLRVATPAAVRAAFEDDEPIEIRAWGKREKLVRLGVPYHRWRLDASKI